MYRLVCLLVGLTAVVGGAEDRTSAVASGLTQLLSPNGPYPPAAPAPAYNYAGAENDGFTVQSGYEGFILPTGPAPEPHSALHTLGGVALGAGLLTHLLPFPFNKIAFALGTKLGLWILGFLLLLLVGGATTTALCAFTPICTISFLGLGFNRESTRALLTADRLNTATQFVYDAIAKYKKMQARGPKAVNKKKAREDKEALEQKEEREINDTKTDLEMEGREGKSIEKVKKAEEVESVLEKDNSRESNGSHE